MTDYTDALHALNEAAHKAMRAAANEDGAPVQALREIAWDTDYLVDYGVTRAEFKRLRALHQAEKAAGLHKTREEYEADMRDAGRGHLLRR